MSNYIEHYPNIDKYYIESNLEYTKFDDDYYDELQEITINEKIVIEFKVMGSDNEKSLEETCSNALRQIHEKLYTKELQQHHIRHIYVYGFAFKGKEVLICGGEEGDVALENSLQ